MTQDSWPDRWAAWQRRLAQTVRPRRYQHCLGVAELAAQTARHWQLPLEQAQTAGLLHDVARDLPAAELLTLAAAADIPVGPEEEQNPMLLHAPVGAYLLERDWDIRDQAVLMAVSTHTVAAPAMSPLSQVIFLADAAEPGRNGWPGLEEIRRLMTVDLDRAELLCLEDQFRWLNQRGQAVHSRSRQACAYLRRKLGLPAAWEE